MSNPTIGVPPHLPYTNGDPLPQPEYYYYPASAEEFFTLYPQAPSSFYWLQPDRARMPIPVNCDKKHYWVISTPFLSREWVIGGGPSDRFSWHIHSSQPGKIYANYTADSGAASITIPDYNVLYGDFEVKVALDDTNDWSGIHLDSLDRYWNGVYTPQGTNHFSVQKLNNKIIFIKEYHDNSIKPINFSEIDPSLAKKLREESLVIRRVDGHISVSLWDSTEVLRDLGHYEGPMRCALYIQLTPNNRKNSAQIHQLRWKGPKYEPFKEEPPCSCMEVFQKDRRQKSGPRTIKPQNFEPIEAFCDKETGFTIVSPQFDADSLFTFNDNPDVSFWVVENQTYIFRARHNGKAPSIQDLGIINDKNVIHGDFEIRAHMHLGAGNSTIIIASADRFGPDGKYIINGSNSFHVDADDKEMKIFQGDNRPGTKIIKTDDTLREQPILLSRVNGEISVSYDHNRSLIAQMGTFFGPVRIVTALLVTTDHQTNQIDILEIKWRGEYD